MAEPDNEFKDELAKEFAEAFAAETADDGKKPEPAKPEEPAATPPAPAPEAPKVEEPKPNEPAKPADPEKEEPVTPPADPTKPAEKDPTKPETPEAPVAPEEPKPLTEDGIRSIISEVRTSERDAGKELQNTTKEVLDAYYPDGLSNVLVDQASGKELKTPADVVAVAPDMEEAAQWLMNEQFKMDQSVAAIQKDAERIAETTINFKRDSINALRKYEPLFKAYPTLQGKVFDKLMTLVEADEKKGVITKAPDVMDHYDFYLEPYQKAFEFANGQSATNPVPAPAAPAAPTPPKPGQNDRLDENGDGGASPVDDPNDFAQQVTKELAGGM
jgi:hypothetical protein